MANCLYVINAPTKEELQEKGFEIVMDETGYRYDSLLYKGYDAPVWFDGQYLDGFGRKTYDTCRMVVEMYDIFPGFAVMDDMEWVAEAWDMEAKEVTEEEMSQLQTKLCENKKKRILEYLAKVDEEEK